jgi:hypothetical protein
LHPSLLIASLLLAGGANAQAPALGERSRDQVLALPTAEAARTLLGDIASHFVTMTVERNGDVPVEVAFATAPQGTGLPGLCEATVLRVTLVREEDRAAPPAIRGYSVNEVYKVVSEVDGPLGPLGPDEREQARLCAVAGPVLPDPSQGRRAPRFFHHRGHGERWAGVVALQDIIRRARQRRYGPIECTRRELDDCRDPQADLASLDVRDLASIEVVQPDRDQPNFRVLASFVAEPNLATGYGWQVSLDFNGEYIPVRRSGRATFNYGRTRLYRY